MQNTVKKSFALLLSVLTVLCLFIPTFTASAGRIKTVTLSYSANGGSGAPSAKSGESNTYFTVSSVKPSRSGYSFVCWNTYSNGNGTNYYGGNTIKMTANKTLYAKWKKNVTNYTLSFNGNGGSGVPGSITVSSGTTVTIPSKTPSRSGYTFVCWSTTANSNGATATGAGINYHPGGRITVSRNITLYARWQANTYKLYYNSNGGSGAPSGTYYGSSVTVTSAKPTRNGYTFVCWNTSAFGNGTDYYAGNKITLYYNTTLYAKWKANVYSLYYNSNGGNGAPRGSSYASGTVVTVSSAKPTRSGYTFVCWNTSSSGGGTNYYAGSRVTVNRNITLYAIWKKNVTYYTLTYSANGGSGAPQATTAAEGTSVKVSSVKPTRSGYNFVCWSTVSSSSGTGTVTGNGINYNAGDSITLTRNMTLYARWQAKPTYTLSFNANSGSGAPQSVSATEGNYVTIPTKTPTRSGYKFVNWNTSSNGSGTSYAPGSKVQLYRSFTLYAKWEKIPEYVYCNYNANGGRFSQTAPSEKVLKGGTITVISTKPTRPDYIFVCWNTNNKGTGKDYNAGDKIQINAATVLYAKWKPVNEYVTITYNLDGGSGNFPPKKVACGSTFTLPSTAPTKTDYKFLGWNSSEDANGASYHLVAPGAKVSVTRNTCFTAAWKKILDCTLTYYANGGYGGPTRLDFEGGKEISISSSIPTRSGYTFVKWTTRKDGSGASYKPGDKATFKGNVTLYANWKQNPYYITFNANGGANPPAKVAVVPGSNGLIPSEIPKNSGCTFVCWNTAANGSGDKYMPNSAIKPTQDMTLYAIWKNNPTVKVTYLTLSGKSESVRSGCYITITSDVPTYSADSDLNSAYQFIGWNTKENGTGTIYKSGARICVTENMKLYPQWKQIAYFLRYESNCVVGTVVNLSGMPKDQKAAAKNTLTVASSKPTRGGYTFTGWNTKSNGSGTAYKGGDTITMTRDITLYAQWKQIPTYTAIFNANGGSNAPAKQSALSGSYIVIPTTTPTRDGYKFVSWTTSQNGNGTKYAPGSKVVLKGNITLYAQWEKNSVGYVTLTYNANGGSGAPAAQKVEKNSIVTISGTEPTRTGYVFRGWTPNPDTYDNTAYLAGAKITLRENMTLYAYWSPASFTLTFDAHGGKIGSTAKTSTTMTAGNPAKISVTPTRTGYTFNGWNTKADGSGKTYLNGKTISITQNTTLYAMWTINQYTLSFKPNNTLGPAFIDNMPEDQTVSYGQKVTFPTTNPSADGYIFAYWCTDPAGVTTPYYAGNTITLNKDITVYAIWKTAK